MKWFFLLFFCCSQATFAQGLCRQAHTLRSLPAKQAEIESSLQQINARAEWAALLAAPNGNLLHVSGIEHVQQVFTQWKIEIANMTSVPRILPATIALHDIGKPLAVRKGNADLQHEMTLPILKTALQEQGFTLREIQLAQALVQNQSLSRLIRGWISVNEAASEIRAAAQSCGLSPRDFLKLKSAFFKADAGSYGKLRLMLFDLQPDGTLLFKSPLIAELEALL